MSRPPDIAPTTVIDDARTGDTAAFSQLWRTYQPQLLRYLVAKRVSPSQDVASQVWIDVAGSLIRFEGDGIDFRRWLFTIAHRRSVDEVRRAVRRPIPIDNEPVSLDRSPGADDVYHDASSLGRALAIVRQLPADMAEAVMLRVVLDFSVEDTAEVMSQTVGNVRVLVHRGLRKLEAQLSEDNSLAAVTTGGPRTMNTLT